MDKDSTEKDQYVKVHVHKKVKKKPEAAELTDAIEDVAALEPPNTFDPQPIGPEFTAAPIKKRKIKKWIAIAVVIVVFLIAAGAGAYYVVNNKPVDVKKTSNNSNSPNTKTKTTVSSLKSTAVALAVQDYLKTKYPQVMPEGTELAAEQIYFKTTNKAPNWKIPGEKFYISYIGDGASDLAVYYNWESGGSNVASARFVGISNAIIKSLTDQGFAKNTDSVYGANSGYIAYTKDDVVCVTSNPENGSISPPASVACGQISMYTKNLESYKEIEPYTTAYAKTGKMQEGDIFGFSALKAGMKGYKNAEVSIGNVGAMVGGAMGLFYKTPKSAWIFLGGTQQTLPCTTYDTKDLQYAFAFENCYDATKTGDDTNSNVASYYKLQS